MRCFDTRYDVAVVGGGVAGIGTALALAESGKRVLLLERRAMPAWEVTSAFHVGLADSHKPVTHRIHQRINAMGAMVCDRVDIPHYEILMDRMLDESGVELLLFCQATGLVVEDGAATGVAVGHKSGENVLRADVFVDATEHGVLWRQTMPPTNLTAASRRSIFFNAVAALPPERIVDRELGEVRLFRSVREGEVCVEYTLPSYDEQTSRACDLQVTRRLRELVPELKSATVTHASFEPMPLGPLVSFRQKAVRHPAVRNLYGAGPWATESDLADCVRRSEFGEDVAELILRETGRTHPVTQLLVEPETPVVSSQVVVVGGGTAGALAAIAAGREGASVTLLESSTLLGGIVTGSTMFNAWHGVPGGLQEEFQARCQALHADLAAEHPVPRIHPEAGKIVLEQMCQEAGVRIFYGTIGLGAQMQGRRITGVLASTPTGKVLFCADVVIDSTGDGDIAVKAGAEVVPVGRETDGVIHCYTQCAQMYFPARRLCSCNFDSGYCDPTDVADLTRARREGVRQLAERFSIRMEDGSHMTNICPIVGLRQSRQIVGDHIQTMLEQIEGATFDDCIGYSAAKYDCHSQDYENQQDLPVLWVWLLGNRERLMGGQIPYRMLLPKGVDGLLVACRAASADNEAHYQYRTIRNQFRTGEAAGIAAAISVREGVLPREVDVRAIQERLRASGALSEAVEPGPVVPAQSLDELRQTLLSNRPKDAVWLLAMGGERERELLREVVSGGPASARFWAAVALAWHRDEAALPELVKAVNDRMSVRSDYTPRSRNMVPLWQSCIVLLGRIGSPKAVPALLEVLNDHSIDMDVIIAIVRALGRIQDDSVVPTLETLLAHAASLPHLRKFQQTDVNARYPTTENGLWQIELCLAEVLAQFGRPCPRIVEKYLADLRLHVRRYAEMVGERSAATVSVG